METLQSQKIDLIFLDIHLPKLKGFEFIESLQYHPNIIITTAYSDYAIQAFDANDAVAIQDRLGAVAPALGASGAIMGVMAAFAYTFPNTELYMMFIPIPVKAKYAVAGLILLDLFGGVARVSGDNIAHFAHLGGAITGFIIVLIWNKKNRRTLY